MIEIFRKTKFEAYWLKNLLAALLLLVSLLLSTSLPLPLQLPCWWSYCIWRCFWICCWRCYCMPLSPSCCFWRPWYCWHYFFCWNPFCYWCYWFWHCCCCWRPLISKYCCRPDVVLTAFDVPEDSAVVRLSAIASVPTAIDVPSDTCVPKFLAPLLLRTSLLLSATLLFLAPF